MDFSIVVRVKKLSGRIGDAISLPRYATDGSAGLDLPACLDEPLAVPPGARVKVPTGIAIEIPHRNIAGLVFPRSGLASKHGISLANAVGVIDSDYKGEIVIAVFNQSDQEYLIKPGERVAQLVFVPVFTATLDVVENLNCSSRGEGGFGSTGRI
ncbi:dUTPase [Pelotomaculum thermopropionicum SI]|uniref:Deoxyuridine 5'-triphosphate nucleotidohydrolase n=1 Tax=Pelotomaculum thermopropionicum (strain DSM 13744 / JCM 10971 / SI) TaxID=370438 RepID=A5D2T0_PELTS|nr:dUTPase [Pelotomaculum thermopropionicum SI]